MNHRYLYLLALAILLVLSGCPTEGDDDTTGDDDAGDDDTGDDDTGDDDGGDDDTGDDDTMPTEVVLGGTWYNWDGSAVSVGADICFEHGASTECTKTDALGTFMLVPPADTEGVLTSAGGAPEVGPTRFPVQTGTEDMGVNIEDMTPVQLASLHADVSMTVDPALATIAIVVVRKQMMSWHPAVGATVELDPEGGSGPYYCADTGWDELDPSAESTTEYSMGIFLGVEPGIRTLSASLDGHVCDERWPGVGSAPVTVDALAGHTTMTQIICTPN